MNSPKVKASAEKVHLTYKQLKQALRHLTYAIHWCELRQ